MKQFKSLIRAVACVAIAVLVYFIGRSAGFWSEVPKFQWSWASFFKAILILAALFALEGLLHYVLGLLKPKRNRTRTLLSLARNVLRYTVILVSICVFLTIFNVDIVTILAGLAKQKR